MFKLFAHFASSRPRNSRSAALALLERGAFADAVVALTALLDDTMAARERAFLINKRGVARMGLGERERARADFEAALAVAPHPPALVNLGNLALEDGRVEEAVARYEAAIAIDAEYAVAYFNLGAAYKRMGRLDDAVRALRRAQRLGRRRR